MKRGRNYTRIQREKAIKRKLFILKNIMDYKEEFFCNRTIGKLAKGKVHCSCKICKYSKHYKLEKETIKSQILETKKEISFYCRCC